MFGTSNLSSKPVNFLTLGFGTTLLPTPPLPRVTPTKVLHLKSHPHPHSEITWELWGSEYTTCDLSLTCVCARSLPAHPTVLYPKMANIAYKKISSKNPKWEAWQKPFCHEWLQVLFLPFELQSSEADQDILTLTLFLLTLSTFLTIFVLEEESIPLPPPVMTIKPKQVSSK